MNREEVLKYIESVFDFEVETFKGQLDFQIKNKSWGEDIQKAGILHSISLIEEMRKYVRENLK